MRAIFRLVGFGEDRIIKQEELSDIFKEETIDEIAGGELTESALGIELPYVDVVVHIASDRPIDAFIEDMESHPNIKAIVAFDITDYFGTTPVHFSENLDTGLVDDAVDDFFASKLLALDNSRSLYYQET